MKYIQKENIKYIIYLHLLLLFYSFGTICSKSAAMHPVFSTPFIVLYLVVLVILGVYAIMWQQILKKMKLVTAYANKSVTIIWGLIWGLIFFDESITVFKLLGVAIIIVGVYFVVTGDER